jgi:hypothetical protein
MLSSDRDTSHVVTPMRGVTGRVWGASAPCTFPFFVFVYCGMAQSLGTVGNSKQNAPHLNFVMARGEEFYAVMDLDETLFEFDDWTLKMQVVARADKSPVFTFTGPDSLTFNKETGEINLYLSAEETAQLQDGEVYDYDIRVRIPNVNSSILFWGKIIAETWITQGD